MIDVLLVLLSIFMVIVMRVMAERDRHRIEASIPDSLLAATGAASIVLDVTGAERYAPDTERIAGRDALAARPSAVYAGRADRAMFLKGERDVSDQAVITAMDVARGAGVTVLGLTPRETR